MTFTCLELDLGGQPNPVIGTYQDDDGWGLWLTDVPVRWDGHDGIFRTISPDLPTGNVGALDVRIDEGILAEILIPIGDRQVLLIAGEAHEDWSGGFDVHRFDESVLTFEAPADADRLEWVPARRHGSEAS